MTTTADTPCPRCSAPKHMGRCKKANVGNCEPETPVETSDSDTLEVLPGFGFRAFVVGGHLQIEQDDTAGNTDTVVLSRTEARVLFAQFSEWAS